MPVLKDPRLGSYSVKEHFADTPSHLVAASARLRTDELADQLQRRQFWTRAELMACANQPSKINDSKPN